MSKKLSKEKKKPKERTPDQFDVASIIRLNKQLTEAKAAGKTNLVIMLNKIIKCIEARKK